MLKIIRKMEKNLVEGRNPDDRLQKADRQTDRQTDGRTDKQTDRQTDRSLMLLE